MQDPQQAKQTVTRRDFVVKASAAAVAGPAIITSMASALPARAWAHAAGSDKIKVGVIGCGGRGTGAVGQALAADPGTILWAMGDAFKDKLETSLGNLTQQMLNRDEQASESQTTWQDKIDVPEERRFVGFDAYQQVINSGVDVVILTTPPVFRPIHLQAAVAADKHVFCEKPVAVDGAGVRSVLDSARQAKAKGLCLMSGYCWHYSDPERATMQQVHDGAIGQIRAVHTIYNTNGWSVNDEYKPEWSEMEFQLRHWQFFTWLSGDHITEQACHSIDKMNWAMNGELPLRCSAIGGRQVREDLPQTGNVYDHFGVTWDYPSGARGYHTCRHWPGTPFDNSDYIMGSDGTCYINGWDRQNGHIIKGKTNWKYTGSHRNMYQTEHDELFAAIRAGKQIWDGDWMAHSSLLSIMGRMAAYTGQTVTWDQALNSKWTLTPKQWAWGPKPVDPVAMPGKTPLL